MEFFYWKQRVKWQLLRSDSGNINRYSYKLKSRNLAASNYIFEMLKTYIFFILTQPEKMEQNPAHNFHSVFELNNVLPHFPHHNLSIFVAMPHLINFFPHTIWMRTPLDNIFPQSIEVILCIIYACILLYILYVSASVNISARVSWFLY